LKLQTSGPKPFGQTFECEPSQRFQHYCFDVCLDALCIDGLSSTTRRPHKLPAHTVKDQRLAGICSSRAREHFVQGSRASYIQIRVRQHPKQTFSTPPRNRRGRFRRLRQAPNHRRGAHLTCNPRFVNKRPLRACGNVAARPRGLHQRPISAQWAGTRPVALHGVLLMHS